MQMSEKQLRPLHIRQMRGRVQKPRLSQGKELQVMKKPRLTTIFSMILIFAGISLALYPTISNILAQKHASQAITEYNDEIKDMDEEKIDVILACGVSDVGLGFAVMNRMMKSAGYNIINLTEEKVGQKIDSRGENDTLPI